MKSFKRYISALILVVLIFSLVGCSSVTKEALKPVEKLIGTLYFKNGTYDEYKTIFTNSKNAFNKEQFEKFSSNSDKSSFKYGSDSIEDVTQHLKAEKIDNATAEVYYLEDVAKTDKSKALMKWTVIKENGKWLLKND